MDISIHRGLLGNLEGVSLAGTFERKDKVYLGSFLGTRRHYDYKSGGPYGTLVKGQGSPE